jgi:hypothetical protein
MGLWKVLREPESCRRYCGTAILFLAFCLKASSLPPNKVPARFTDRQRAILRNYEEDLQADVPPSENDIEMFQDALSCVLFRENGLKINAGGRLACPVQSFMALLSLRKTGDFVKAGLVTQPISRLLYLSRSVVLRTAIRDGYEDGEDDGDFIR